jgi:hypothetical protein
MPETARKRRNAFCTEGRTNVPQINFHTTPQFDADLAALTQALKLRSKSEAIRLAVHEFAAALRENAARKAQAAKLSP